MRHVLLLGALSAAIPAVKGAEPGMPPNITVPAGGYDVQCTGCCTTIIKEIEVGVTIYVPVCNR